MRQVVPYDPNLGKKEQVAVMFDRIAYRYDFLNDFLSLGIENSWKKRLVKLLKPYKPSEILDVATGTGDLVIYLSKLRPNRIVGIDISEKMLEIARKKADKKLKQPGLKVEFYRQDSENMQCKDRAFDLVTCAFGVRNFEDLTGGLRQMYRVLKDGGVLAILEFSRSKQPVFSRIFNFYFEKFLPYLGGIIAKDYKAYKYLPESVKQFPQPPDFIRLVESIGFKTLVVKQLTFGVATIYLFGK